MAKQPSRARARAKAAVDKRRGKDTPQTKSRRKPEPEQALPYDDEQVNETLFPTGKRVTLSTGEKVEVRPWSVSMFGEMAQRIPQTFELATRQDPDADGPNPFAAMFIQLIDEVIFMVSRTIGWDEEQTQEMSMDDLLLVSLVIWDECIQGPMGKVGGLMGRVLGTVTGVTVPLRGQAMATIKSPAASSSQSSTS